ncbi:MAG: DUF3299 domain-containing protein [Gammaproteobacteria bacterium]|nr:DUF3299 domain-containing protein [Gammaproteobacteria bacterium]
MPKLLLAVLAAVMLSQLWPAQADDEAIRKLEWDDLMPQTWDPFAQIRALSESGKDLQDGSPEADAAMKAYLNAGRNAPVVEALNGQRVRLPGFIVPLSFEGTEVNEFLLVPYRGACIHVPPPPSNQVVHVKLAQAYSMRSVFEAVWVTGTMRTQRFDNDLGDAAYTLEATEVKPYE